MSILNNLTSLTVNDSIYTISLFIAHLKADQTGNIRLPINTATGELVTDAITPASAKTLMWRDVQSLKIRHNVTSPILTASLVYRDENNFLVNHVNTNKSILSISILRSPTPDSWSGSSTNNLTTDTSEYDYTMQFIVDSSNIINYTDSIATYELKLVSLNWFNFNNNFVGGTMFFRTWEDLLTGWFSQNFPKPSTNKPILNTRGYTFNSTISPYITPANSTLLDAMDYAFNRIITSNNGLFFVTYNPLAPNYNYYLWKYNDDAQNAVLNPRTTSNIIILQDKSVESKFTTRNASFKLQNKSWSGATEIFSALRGFSTYAFNYDKGIWDSSMNSGTSTDNALRVTSNSLINMFGGNIVPPIGYSKKYVNSSPRDPSLIPNETNRFWYEWSSSNRQESLWEKFRKIILENGITIATVSGDLRRLPGSLMYIHSSTGAGETNTSAAFIGVRNILQIEHEFTQTTYNNNIYFGTIFSLTDIANAI